MLIEDISKYAENNKRAIYGFPLNFTFTDFEKIWHDLDSTGIIEEVNQKEQDQFVLTVECCAYSNYIVSVWVFIAILQDTNIAIR